MSPVYIYVYTYIERLNICLMDISCIYLFRERERERMREIGRERLSDTNISLMNRMLKEFMPYFLILLYTLKGGFYQVKLLTI